MHNKPLNVDEPSEVLETTSAPEDSAAYPWVTRLACVVCVAIFLGLAAQNDYKSWAAVSKFGFFPASAIWRGKIWGLVTCAFVHFDLWHVAFNVYWLWILGCLMERAIGSLRFLAFLVTAAFVSSSFQLALSDTTGIGASGMVYAIFGFMWLTRHIYPGFNQVLDMRTIRTFVIWLVGCVVATYLKIWNIGNGAHISGLLFGAGVAAAFVLGIKPGLMRSGLASLVALSVGFLFWCPWSVVWLSQKAYAAHGAKRYEDALGWYGRLIALNPNNSWAYLNRSDVYEELGQPERAQADLQKARKIDPSIGHSGEASESGG